jgi:tetratricopeptide (TPR) repeat protein
MAEVTYQKSLDALSSNNAQIVYNLMTSAVAQNPYVDRYHASMAQIDMALANSIAAGKTTLTDTDRTTLTQLIQQAISEGKATVTLNPGRSGNWGILAQIYGSIMPFTQGADQFAIQAYTQAVALDPINPNLRISLGGVYYALGRYDDAIEAFKLAVLAKSDLANAHYNLSIAYRDKKDYDDAITEMNTVLILVPKDSSDYTLAQSTLADLQKNKPAATSVTGAGALTIPQKQVTTVKPPITLPQEATPPATNQ